MEEFFAGVATPCRLIAWFYVFFIPFTATVGAIVGAICKK